MNFNEYQQLAARTANGGFNRESKMNFTMGLTGEAGEVSDLMKKHFFHGHDLDTEELKKELGDIMWYVSNLARVYHINFEDVAIANIEKLRQRYPDGFSTEASINRVDVQEG